MTTDLSAATDEEFRATLARFDAEPDAPESYAAAVERVAAALFAAQQEFDGDFYIVAWEDNYARTPWYNLARAAIAALTQPAGTEVGA